MSGIAHNTPATLPLRLRRSRFTWIAVAVVAIAIAITVVLVVSGDDSNSSPTAVTPSVATQPAGVRYDGGPEEGTRGLVTSPSSPNTRYDGGPEEGTRGLGH